MNGLVKWLDRINAQKKEGGDKGGAKSWWRWPLLIVLVLAGLAVGAYILNRNGKELARLRHAKNKAVIEKNNDLANGIADREIARAKEALVRVRKADRAILKIEIQLGAAEARHEKDKAIIERMRWGDLPRGD